jgi:hypothetical protein
MISWIHKFYSFTFNLCRYAVAPLGPDRFEEQQERFATDERLNDIYRRGEGPAAVHGFYMYTWAAHGMSKVGKVFVVGAEDSRGPDVLKWDMKDSVKEAGLARNTN